MTSPSRFVLLIAAVVACGCGYEPSATQSPTAPTQSPTAPPAGSRFQQIRIAGRVVDSANNPVPGASLSPWDSGETRFADENGAFDTTVSVNPQGRTFWITVQKPGFETSELNRNLDTATTTMLRLHQSHSITTGQSWHSVINADDSSCGYHWGYICRRVRVDAPSAGTLTIEVSPYDGAVLGIPLGPVGFAQTFERHVMVPVKAGSETSFDIAAGLPLDSSAAFTLNTSLTPAN